MGWPWDAMWRWGVGTVRGRCSVRRREAGRSPGGGLTGKLWREEGPGGQSRREGASEGGSPEGVREEEEVRCALEGAGN